MITSVSLLAILVSTAIGLIAVFVVVVRLRYVPGMRWSVSMFGSLGALRADGWSCSDIRFINQAMLLSL